VKLNLKEDSEDWRDGQEYWQSYD